MQVQCNNCGMTGKVDESKYPSDTFELKCPKCKIAFSVNKVASSPVYKKDSIVNASNPVDGADTSTATESITHNMANSNESTRAESYTTKEKFKAEVHKGSNPKELPGDNVDKFERNLLFKLVRGVSLIMGALGLFALVFGALMLVKSWTTMKGEKEVKITQKEVQELVSKKERIESGDYGTPNESTSKTSSEETISPEIKKALMIIDEIVAILLKDRADLDADKVKEIIIKKADNYKESEVLAYLNKMKSIVANAPEGKKTAYIDSFMELYAEKLEKERLKAEEKKFEALKNVGTYAYVTITGLLTAISFGIILILAAIERNTRVSIGRKT